MIDWYIMWKPGTTEPQGQSLVQNSTKGIKSVTVKSKVKTNVKKKLSGATMGMRFMKRKLDEAAQAKRIKEEKQKQATTKQSEESGWSIQTADDNNPNNSSQDTNVVECDDIPEIATASDMYGVVANIIGRRSFGGFNKHVSETWNNTLEEIQNNRTSNKMTKQHISDDELLRRYEKYVKGRSSNKNMNDKSNKRREKRKRD